MSGNTGFSIVVAKFPFRNEKKKRGGGTTLKKILRVQWKVLEIVAKIAQHWEYN